MLAKAIIQEIERLPISQRFWVIEQTLKSIKKEELLLEQKLSEMNNNYQIPEIHKSIVRERMDDAKRNPDNMVDWDDIKDSI